MTRLPVDLGGALDRACAALPRRELGAAVDRLVARSRDPRPATGPNLATAAAAAAYAAHRMPATWAAARHALAALAERAPGFRPRTLLDLGGGTGAALWAVAGLFPSLTGATVLDHAQEALRFGRALAAGSGHAAVRNARWVRGSFGTHEPLAEADLVTVSYVLSELTEADQGSLIMRATEAGRAVAVLESGTRDGHRRVLAARERLIAAGLTVLAPCTHQGACPLGELREWCHFGVRVARPAVQRALKGGEGDHEDERFSYVVALRRDVADGGAAGAKPARGRILREPIKRNGMVTLQVCTRDDGIVPTLISKRQGSAYEAAIEAAWGDTWPKTVAR